MSPRLFFIFLIFSLSFFPSDMTIEPGTIVFAKLKGYPWWPAKVEDDDGVPAHILSQKSKGSLYTVCFYGTQDYGFFGPDAIRPFDHVIVERDLKAKKFKSKDLEGAVTLAFYDMSAKRKSEDSEEPDRKKRCTHDMEMQQKVYHLRRRLQRLVYNKKEGEIPKEDYARIASVIKEIEDTPITYPLLKDTKIGKVVKSACSYPFGAEYDINERCQQLMKQWKIHFIDQ